MLQTQINYWANQEAKRHNIALEDVARQEARTKQQDADTKRFEAQTNRYRMETDAVNALTAQTEAATRQAAQRTNEQRLMQDYEIALRDLAVKETNADSTRTQANASAFLDYARGEQSKVETVYIPYQSGANIAGSLVTTVSKAAGPLQKAGKAVKGGISTLLYNLRN